MHQAIKMIDSAVLLYSCFHHRRQWVSIHSSDHKRNCIVWLLHVGFSVPEVAAWVLKNHYGIRNNRNFTPIYSSKIPSILYGKVLWIGSLCKINFAISVQDSCFHYCGIHCVFESTCQHIWYTYISSSKCGWNTHLRSFYTVAPWWLQIR